MSALMEWTPAEGAAVGLRPLVARHRLHELALFDDAALLRVLERYPREWLQAFTMGDDVGRPEEWRPVDVAGLSGAALWDAIERERLWIHLPRVEEVEPRYRALLAELTAAVRARCPQLRLRAIPFATLLLSSPGALVYYHADARHHMLWQLRGTKRLWVYPAGDPGFAPPHLMEDVLAGRYEHDGDLPYRPEFDAAATSFRLSPGDVASWPLHAPHRLVNDRVPSVSLVTPLATPGAARRRDVAAANRFFRTRLGLPLTSTREVGIGPTLKRLAYRLCRRAGLVPGAPLASAAPRPPRVARRVP